MPLREFSDSFGRIWQVWDTYPKRSASAGKGDSINLSQVTGAGPTLSVMAEFLTTHGTAFQIENVIAGARKQLTLVSPFLKLSKEEVYILMRGAGDEP